MNDLKARRVLQRYTMRVAPSLVSCYSQEEVLAIVREIRQHLEEIAAEEVGSGRSELSAARLAVRQFGDPSQLATQLREAKQRELGQTVVSTLGMLRPGKNRVAIFCLIMLAAAALGGSVLFILPSSNWIVALCIGFAVSRISIACSSLLISEIDAKLIDEARAASSCPITFEHCGFLVQTLEPEDRVAAENYVNGYPQKTKRFGAIAKALLALFVIVSIVIEITRLFQPAQPPSPGATHAAYMLGMWIAILLPWARIRPPARSRS